MGGATAAATTGSLGAQPALTPVRIATPGGDAFAEPFFGTDQGDFAKAGFDPQISILNNAGAVLAAVSGGSIDIGLGDIVGIADAIEHGIPLVVFAGGGLYLSSAPTTVLCVEKNSTAQRAKDFNGKAVAVVTLGRAAGCFDQSVADEERGRYQHDPAYRDAADRRWGRRCNAATSLRPRSPSPS